MKVDSALGLGSVFTFTMKVSDIGIQPKVGQKNSKKKASQRNNGYLQVIHESDLEFSATDLTLG